MVHAEKLVTALQRGTANTRWREFADIYLLTARHDIPGDELQSTITRVAAHRQAELAPLREILDGYPAIAQPRWAAWRRGQGLDDRLPSQSADVLDHVIIFAHRPHRHRRRRHLERRATAITPGARNLALTPPAPTTQLCAQTQIC
jgi:hypothetical protein